MEIRRYKEMVYAITERVSEDEIKIVFLIPGATHTWRCDPRWWDDFCSGRADFMLERKLQFLKRKRKEYDDYLESQNKTI